MEDSLRAFLEPVLSEYTVYAIYAVRFGVPVIMGTISYIIFKIFMQSAWYIFRKRDLFKELDRFVEKHLKFVEREARVIVKIGIVVLFTAVHMLLP